MPNDPEDFNKMNPDNKDDFIDSSFGVRFTPGDKTESVADKLKETKENIEKKAADVNAAGGTSRFDANADNFKDQLKDEFDNFEFDSSISAFKPFSTPAHTDSASSAPMPDALKPSKASTTPAFPKDGGTFDKPAFAPNAQEPSKDAIPDFSDIKGKENSANDKFFKSGDGLDFATSEHDKKTSPFANAEKPAMPKSEPLDIPKAEKPAAPAAPAAPAKPVNPFASSTPEQKPAAQDASKAQGYRPYPSQAKTNLFTSPAQATKDAEKAFAEFLDDDFKPSNKAPISPFKSAAPAAKPAAPAAPAKTAAPVAPAAPAKPAEPAKPAAPVAPAAPAKPVAPAAPVKPVEPAKPAAPVAPAAPVKPAEPAKATTVTGAVVTAASAAAAASATAPKAAEPVKPAAPAQPAAPVKPAEPAKATTANGSVVAPVAAPKAPETVKAPAETAQPQRPAASAPKAEAPAPKAEAPSQRPGASNSKPASAPQFPSEAPATKNAAHGSHQDKSIQPVTTVKKSKKRAKDPKSAKDPGLAGLITFLVIIFLAIGILWALDNTSGIRSLFGKKTIETIPTVTSETTAATSKEQTTETETEATTTTTEATTTTTEATTTTTEATTTTTEATTTTTEATTTTTEATTTTTVATVTTVGNEEPAETAEGSCVTAINTKITKFKTMENGFKFTIELYNTSNTTCSLPKSLNYLDMKFFCNSTITEVKSECFNFSAKKDGVTFRGTPKEVTIKGRATYSFTVYVYTKENVSKYGYNTAYFDWKK